MVRVVVPKVVRRSVVVVKVRVRLGIVVLVTLVVVRWRPVVVTMMKKLRIESYCHGVDQVVGLLVNCPRRTQSRMIAALVVQTCCLVDL